jgi:hypothetical protein
MQQRIKSELRAFGKVSTPLAPSHTLAIKGLSGLHGIEA